MIKIKWAELHTPLFLAGTNLGLKLDPHKRTKLEMVYNRPEKELLVTFTNTLDEKETAIVPLTNVASMIEGQVHRKGEETLKPDEWQAPKKATAQLETPQSHVFAGAGHGKTGK